MRVALTGATGLVGYGIAGDLSARGHEVVALGRRPVQIAGVAHLPFDLGADAPDLSGFDALVHAAFSHVPGKYRGGEGDDPDGFLQRNLDGTRRLFDAAAGLDRIVFLSSRAVYGAYPPGTVLHEDLPPLPDTLYGHVKHRAETALSALSGPVTVSLRATGVYGATAPGQRHKWDDLFRQFAAGQTVPPRIATEVHIGDLAAAVDLALSVPRSACGDGIFNVSDFALDQRALLQTYSALTGTTGPLPEAADPASVSEMTTGRLRALGWAPTGRDGFASRLSALLAADAEGSAARPGLAQRSQ